MTLVIVVGVGVVCGAWFMFRCSRRRAEAAERLHAVTLSSIGDAVIATDVQGTITFFNPEAERLTGWPRVDAIGAPLANVFHVTHEDTGVAADNPISHVMRTGQPQALSNHTRLHSRDGRTMPIENKASPIRHADGTVDGVVLIFRDCTQRHQVEDALRERLLLREQLARIADTAPGVICAYRVRPDGSGCFPFASARIQDVYGLTAEELARDAGPAFDAIHPDDVEHVRTSAAESARTLEEWRSEFRVNHPTRGLIWVEGRSMPELEPDGSVLWRGFLNDITERRELESELQQAQKMESVGLLAGGVAHDFNNALTVIMGSTEVLAEEIPKSEEAAVMLGEIRKATDRAASLTRQLLAFSRKDVVASRVVDFNALVSNTERMLRRLLGEDIELVASLDPAVAHVRVDPGQWDQVLVNLAVNARDAIGGCGRLAIETRDVVIDARSAAAARGAQPGRYVRLSVTDTGCGMRPDVLSRVFEPFFTTKGVGRGTGLGLAVVYGIVRQSGGHIDVQSHVNTGTTFTILIPAVDAAIDAGVSDIDVQPSSSHAHETILVVEDEDSLRRMAARVLAKQGYTVLEAASGPDALRLLDDGDCRIDLLVTDVVMPTMDGRELAERVRQKQPSTKVLFTSGYTEDAILHRGVEAARVAFLQKPYAPAVLSSKVLEVLRLPQQPAA